MAVLNTFMKATFFWVILLMGISIFAYGCKKKTDKPTVGVQSFYLDKDQIKEMEATAKTDVDGKVAHRLSRYYYYYENNQTKGLEWLNLSASKGNKDAKKDLEAMGK